MQFIEQTLDGVTVIYIKGNLDAAHITSFSSKLQQSICAGEKKILIDFSGMKFICSAGLRVLIMGKEEASDREKHIVFCSLNKDVYNLLRITNLIECFEIYPSKMEALTVLGKI